MADKVGAGVKPTAPGNGFNVVFRGKQIVFCHADPVVQQVCVEGFSGDGLENLAEIIGMVAEKLRNFSVGQG